MAETRERIRDSREREWYGSGYGGYKYGGCSGGGVFVSWIEAWERLREKEWDKKKKKEREESSYGCSGE